MTFFAFNWVAVVAATIANQLLGATWFNVFGKPWVQALEKTLPPDAQDQMPRLLVRSLVTNAFECITLASLFQALGITTFAAAVPIVFWLWVGLSAAPTFNSYGWAHRKLNLFLIDSGHVLAGLLLISFVYLQLA